MQLTLSEEHYAYVAPKEGAEFAARVATAARDVKVTMPRHPRRHHPRATLEQRAVCFLSRVTGHSPLQRL